MKDIRQKTDQELRTGLAENREALRQFRFGIAGSGASNPKEGRSLRVEIARSMTELNRRKREAA